MSVKNRDGDVSLRNLEGLQSLGNIPVGEAPLGGNRLLGDTPVVGGNILFGDTPGVGNILLGEILTARSGKSPLGEIEGGEGFSGEDPE
jgi:hypothetical protein